MDQEKKLKDFSEKVKKNYEDERTIEEFINWTKSVCCKFHKLKNGNEKLQLNRVYKKISEEAVPIKTFLEKNKNLYSNVQLAYDAPEEFSWDGKLFKKDTEEPVYIEVTMAVDGKEEMDLNKEIDKKGYGHVSSVREQNGRKGILPRSNDNLKNIIEKILCVIKKKEEKKYYKNTILLVSLGRIDLLMSPPERENKIVNKLKKELPNKSSHFESIWLVFEEKAILLAER